jgi:23S rRNA (guanosine2251-2'-O)-methyltransferase
MEKIKNEDLNRLTIKAFKEAQKLPIILVLDNIRSLNNVGSIFRTADAFLIESIFLCGVTGTPPNKEIEKTALGATDTVTWEYYSNTQEAIDALKIKQYKIYAVEQVENSIALQNIKIDVTQKMALVLGNEVYGVDQAVVNNCFGSIEIPQLGTKHSLNVSVSAGIVVWEIAKLFMNKD